MNNDLETKLLMFRLCLKEERTKKYSEECDTNSVYIFNNFCEFRDYFTSNGYDDISFDDVESCKIKTLGNGKVVVSKYLCDKMIKKYRQKVKTFVK